MHQRFGHKDSDDLVFTSVDSASVSLSLGRPEMNLCGCSLGMKNVADWLEFQSAADCKSGADWYSGMKKHLIVGTSIQCISLVLFLSFFLFLFNVRPQSS